MSEKIRLTGEQKDFLTMFGVSETLGETVIIQVPFLFKDICNSTYEVIPMLEEKPRPKERLSVKQ